MMALKHLFEIALLTSAIALARASYECIYRDGRHLYCDSCCEYDCCSYSANSSDSAAIVGGCVAAGFVFIVTVLLCCICIRRRRTASNGQVLVQHPSNVLVVSRTNQAAGDSTATAVTGRTVYNPNVPQTGPYAYEQPTTFAIFPSGYIPRTDTLGEEAPPAYSPQK
ncbi:hypothetical protein ACJMK2_016545 [Sinanodonta woodiana]|uniref:Uncharacterized protein n=1 Tax=Sinanodonta woodiana TaxID=1069815 RepID=A0ABD3UXE2_SINWO